MRLPPGSSAPATDAIRHVCTLSSSGTFAPWQTVTGHLLLGRPRLCDTTSEVAGVTPPVPAGGVGCPGWAQQLADACNMGGCHRQAPGQRCAVPDRLPQELARRVDVSITGFWTLGAATPFLPAPIMVVGVVIAIAIGFTFFYTVSQVAAEGTEFRPFDFWHVPWGGRAPVREKRTMTLNLLSPTWWTKVVDATGWPSTAVWFALGGTLLASLFGALTQW